MEVAGNFSPQKILDPEKGIVFLRCKAEGKSLERLTALCNPMCLGGLNRAKQFYSPRVNRSKTLCKEAYTNPQGKDAKGLEITTRVVPWQPERLRESKG